MIATAQPKPRLRALAKQDRVRARQTVDDRESQKVRMRSQRQCERRERLSNGFVARCIRRAFPVHHMLGGIGRRGIGDSAKAIRKQHLCAQCHTEIGNGILQRLKGGVPHWTDVYRRMR